MLSPVFRDMMDIGESSTVGRNDDNERPKKRPRIEKAQEEIPVDDDAATLECMFSLLANPKSSNIRVWNVSTWLKTLEIADKYDYSLYYGCFQPPSSSSTGLSLDTPRAHMETMRVGGEKLYR
jgi:hypothetical protein